MCSNTTGSRHARKKHPPFHIIRTPEFGMLASPYWHTEVLFHGYNLSPEQKKISSPRLLGLDRLFFFGNDITVLVPNTIVSPIPNHKSMQHMIFKIWSKHVKTDQTYPVPHLEPGSRFQSVVDQPLEQQVVVQVPPESHGVSWYNPVSVEDDSPDNSICIF